MTNNEARFRVTQVGKCGVKWGPDSPAEYRMYLLQHLVLRQITVASLAAPGPGGMLHVDSRTLEHASDGTCQLDLDYQVENHGGTATQAFKSGARVGMPPTSAVQVGMPQLAQGAAAPAHVVLSLREGGNTLAIHPVVITTGGGAELYGVNSQSMTVMVDGSCQPKRP